jgi:hypothetical protein
MGEPLRDKEFLIRKQMGNTMFLLQQYTMY